MQIKLDTEKLAASLGINLGQTISYGQQLEDRRKTESAVDLVIKHN